MYGEFPVDRVVARKHVPTGYELRIHPDGNAILLLMVQDCDRCLLEGVIPVTPMRMSHIWIELAGPEEVGPALPGTKASLPTHYYYALPHQIDSGFACFALRLVGIDVRKVERISMGGDPGGTRQGVVVYKQKSIKGYSWEDSSTLWTEPKVLTGRRWFHREYGKTIRRRSEGQVVCLSRFLGVGKVRLQADMGSAIGDLGFGTTMQGTMNPVRMDYCNVRIRVTGR
jgi:hypothetical protein